MSFYAYKLTHDDGAAPCVQGGLLTLAVCKPDIRCGKDSAKIGDYLVGVGGVNLGLGRLIYMARITKILEDGQYYKFGAYQDRLDCAYEEDLDNPGQPVHRGYPWEHYNGNFDGGYEGRGGQTWSRDVGRGWRHARVLLSQDYRYFGDGTVGPAHDLLCQYGELRSLIEMNRTSFNAPHLKITPARREWPEIQLIRDNLWQSYAMMPEGTHATHYKDDPRPKDWSTFNKEMNRFRKQYPFTTAAKQAFGFRR
jgi:hypothetical protein